MIFFPNIIIQSKHCYHGWNQRDFLFDRRDERAASRPSDPRKIPTEGPSWGASRPRVTESGRRIPRAHSRHRRASGTSTTSPSCRSLPATKPCTECRSLTSLWLHLARPGFLISSGLPRLENSRDPPPAASPRRSNRPSRCRSRHRQDIFFQRKKRTTSSGGGREVARGRWGKQGERLPGLVWGGGCDSSQGGEDSLGMSEIIFFLSGFSPIEYSL